MTTELRNVQRDESYRVLSMVAPDAPMLCPGWTVFGPVVHTWILNHEPLVRAGMLLPSFSWLADREIRRMKKQLSYARLVEEIRTGPASSACMPTDLREDHRHSLGEYFVHTGGIRRPNRLPKQEIPPDLAEALWWRLRTASWQLRPFVSWKFRILQSGHERIGRDPVAKQITGESGELLMQVYRRTEAAQVEIVKF